MQIHYKEDFEKNKGKAYSQVVDTPEFLRLKKSQQQISDVSPEKPAFTGALMPYQLFYVVKEMEAAAHQPTWYLYADQPPTTRRQVDYSWKDLS